MVISGSLGGVQSWNPRDVKCKRYYSYSFRECSTASYKLQCLKMVSKEPVSTRPSFSKFPGQQVTAQQALWKRSYSWLPLATFPLLAVWLVVAIAFHSNVYGHIRSDTDVWLCTFMTIKRSCWCHRDLISHSYTLFWHWATQSLLWVECQLPG